MSASDPDCGIWSIIVLRALLAGHGDQSAEACNVVSARTAESGRTIAQEYVADKSNGITAIPHLIKLDQSDTRSLPKRRRRVMLDLTCRDCLRSQA